MIKKSRTIVLPLTLVLFVLMLTACDDGQQMGAGIDCHIQESGDKLENRIQESQILVYPNDLEVEAQENPELLEQ